MIAVGSFLLTLQIDLSSLLFYGTRNSDSYRVMQSDLSAIPFTTVNKGSQIGLDGSHGVYNYFLSCVNTKTTRLLLYSTTNNNIHGKRRK